MLELEIIKLENGWADLQITIGHCIFSCNFEYTPNDAFLDLLKSPLSIANGGSSHICFPDGAICNYLSVEPADSFNCKITFHSTSVIISIKEYARSVLRLFDKYLYHHSVHDYSISWRHSFPVEEIDTLRQQHKLYPGK